MGYSNKYMDTTKTKLKLENHNNQILNFRFQEENPSTCGRYRKKTEMDRRFAYLGMERIQISSFGYHKLFCKSHFLAFEMGHWGRLQGLELKRRKPNRRWWGFLRCNGWAEIWAWRGKIHFAENISHGRNQAIQGVLFLSLSLVCWIFSSPWNLRERWKTMNDRFNCKTEICFLMLAKELIVGGERLKRIKTKI